MSGQLEQSLTTLVPGTKTADRGSTGPCFQPATRSQLKLVGLSGATQRPVKPALIISLNSHVAAPQAIG
jgi:hypothetical protein